MTLVGKNINYPIPFMNINAKPLNKRMANYKKVLHHNYICLFYYYEDGWTCSLLNCIDISYSKGYAHTYEILLMPTLIQQNPLYVKK